MNFQLNNWCYLPLSEISQINTHQIQPFSFDGYDKYLGLENIEKDTGKITSYQDVEKANIKSSKFEFTKNSILFGKLRPYLRKVALPNVSGICSTDILSITPDETRIRKEYLYFFLRSQMVTEWATAKSTGANLPRISPNLLLKLIIPIPLIEIQEKIIELLGSNRKIIDKHELALNTTYRIIQSIFTKMFYCQKFKIETIGAHVKEIDLKDPRNKPNDYFKYVDIASVDNKIGKIIETKNILGKNAPSRARKVLNTDDVIVSTVRPNLNATALVTSEYNNQICSTGFCVLRCKNTLNPKYLYVFTRREDFIENLSQKMKGASYPAVTNDDVLNVEIPIPPIELQNKFSSIVDVIQKMQETQLKSIHRDNLLFESLTSSIFNREVISKCNF